MSDENVLLTIGDFRLRALSDGMNLILEEWKESDPAREETGKKVRKKPSWVFVGYYGSKNLVPALTAMTTLTLEAQPFLQAYEGFQQQLQELADQLQSKIDAQD